MSSRKNYYGMGHTVTRSEFEDGILRDNARHDNRLINEKRHVDKAKKVVVRSYDKESQMLKQKMASAAQRKTTSYFSQPTVPNGTSGKVSSTKTVTGRNSRLIPDYEYKQYRLKHKGEHEDSETRPETEDPKQPLEHTEGQNVSESVNGQIPTNGNADHDFDDTDDGYVSTRPTRPPEEFWNNLSAPKHQSSVRRVRERLAKEFSKPKPKSTTRISGSTQVPAVHGTRLVRK